jgi:uroporphyrinogen decarboxylase
MTSRDRVCAALLGDPVDRVPAALGFRPTPVEHYAPEGYTGPMPDAVSVSFKTSVDEANFQSRVRQARYDTKLGTPELLANYRDWTYWHPDQRNPLARATTAKEILDFSFPNMNDSARHAHLPHAVADFKMQGYAVAGSLPHLGGELFETGWRLRGLETWLLDLVERPELADALLNRLRDMCVANAQILARAGVDILVLDDDVGMPTSMIIGRDLWAKYFKPRMGEIIAAGRAINPDLLVLYHSDGWILPIVDELIEIGVNAQNPIQPDVVDPHEIKSKFGDRITLWGAVGTQATFSDSTPEAVIRETQMCLDTLGPDRLVLCPAYDLVDSHFRWPNIEAFLKQVAKQ